MNDNNRELMLFCASAIFVRANRIYRCTSFLEREGETEKKRLRNVSMPHFCIYYTDTRIATYV